MSHFDEQDVLQRLEECERRLGIRDELPVVLRAPSSRAPASISMTAPFFHIGFRGRRPTTFAMVIVVAMLIAGGLVGWFLRTSVAIQIPRHTDERGGEP